MTNMRYCLYFGNQSKCDNLVPLFSAACKVCQVDLVKNTIEYKPDKELWKYLTGNMVRYGGSSR